MSGRVLKLGAAVLAILALARFAYVHAAQRVDLHLGLFSLRDVSLSVVLYGSMILGMIVVLAVGFRHDLREGRGMVGADRANRKRDDVGTIGGASGEPGPTAAAREPDATPSPERAGGPSQGPVSETEAPAADENEQADQRAADAEGPGGSSGAGPLFEGVDRGS